MSDLSMHGMSLANAAGGPPAAAPEPPTRAAFLWPTPPFAAYPAPAPYVDVELCEIEGPNGNVTHGRMVHFDPAEGVVHVQIPPARGTLPLRLAQFRRLTLLRPIAPTPPPPGMPSEVALAGQGAPHGCRLSFRTGGLTQIDTIGHVDHANGLFLFPPAEAAGSVLRSFYPRASLANAEMGARIGEVLVAQKAATPQQVEEAVADQQALRQRKLGDLMVNEQIVTREQLVAAIEQQARMPMVRIGEALKALGYITDSQLNDALLHQQADRSLPLGELLVRKGVVTRANLQTALARKMGYPVVDANHFPVEPEATQKLPLAIARRLLALPLMLRGGRLVLAMEDPTSAKGVDEAEFSAQCKVVPVLARAGTLAAAIEKAYQAHTIDGAGNGPGLGSGPVIPDAEQDSTNKLLANLEQEQSDGNGLADDRIIEQSDNSLVRLINSMIIEAQQTGVSDIHIECQPGAEKVRIRFRRDGVLKPYIELPPNYRSALVARIKIMCDLDISERRKPQDGKIAFSRYMQGQRLELRVATIPTANGLEDVVMRLLASAKTLPLDGMGLAPDVLAGLKTVIERPYGMVLCVGPTGSGKTTTLHAALGYINTPDRKIWTAEDPVEITQAGLRQVQVNPKIDWTFAKALRAFLRADPDVVMVGEIRDSETAQMAIEASLTGHMVMSTLHTNSAPETVTRLLDMGMDPFSFADSLLAVLAQRLVRRLCKHCVTSRPAEPEEIDALVQEYLNAYPEADKRPSKAEVLDTWQRVATKDGVLTHYHAPGCPQCGNSGFLGRAGLHELLVVDREVRRLIQTSARSEQLQACAMAGGMRTLRQDGIVKVLAGVTAIEEVRAISNN
ncbi:MAG: Flp pilus assembly complex ATPase component TadA [Ideonella sp.]|jgi:type II secretory ATPase GspE/PulE/Tfp pilus assembly ATPase PilB-like protein|nr:Flp pilus assembly complex ATPase component TadA [Ideonella sp.]